MNAITEENQERHSKAMVGLEKAKRLEARRINAGRRYIRINDKLSVLVECDSDGKPTKRGLARIKKYENYVKTT